MISEKMRRRAEDPVIKSGDSDLISEQIKEFVRNGGKIEKIESGIISEETPRLSKANITAMNQENL